MDAQIKSQIFGLSLAVFTAIGCIAYEKIVKSFSLATIIFLAASFYVPLLAILFVSDSALVVSDLKRLVKPDFRWWAVVYWLTWITTPLWFVITKKQGVMAGSIYEVKYVVIMAVIYIFFGEQKMTVNTLVGVCLALGSIYFISK